MGAAEMVKAPAPAANPDNLSLSLRNHTVERMDSP